MSREERIDRAVYQAAWTVSAFGLHAEIIRILRAWDAGRVSELGALFIGATFRAPLPDLVPPYLDEAVA